MQNIRKNKENMPEYVAPDLWIMALKTQDFVVMSYEIGDEGFDNEGEGDL